MLTVTLRTLVAAMTVILFTCGAVADLQQQVQQPHRSQQPQQPQHHQQQQVRRQADANPSIDFASFVDSERLAQQLPGLAAVMVRSDGPPRVYVSGERRVGRGDPIASSDRVAIRKATLPTASFKGWPPGCDSGEISMNRIERMSAD